MATKKKKDTILGIDLGGASIKLVELKKQNGYPVLSTYGFVETQHGAIEGTREGQHETANLLRQVVLEARATTEEVIAALPSLNVFTTIVDMPKMPEKELKSAIEWEAKKLLPLPVEKMMLDWHTLPVTKNATSDEKTQKIILTAAPKVDIDSYLTIFSEAGLKVASLETETVALGRSILPVDDNTIMIIDIGGTTTNMLIFASGVPILIRHTGTGGTTIDHNIANAMNISVDRAEGFKRTIGLRPEERSVHPAARAIKFVIDNMVLSEVQRLMTALADTGNKPVSQIILSGGCVNIQGIAEYFKQTLHIETIIGDPWKKIVHPAELSDDLEKIRSQMTVAVGLALKYFI